MQLQDHDEWIGSCHSTGCLVHLRFQNFQVFPLTVSGKNTCHLWLADKKASDSEGVDLFQVSQGLVDLRQARMRRLGMLSRWIYTCKINTPYKACKNLRQKLYCTCKNLHQLWCSLQKIWLACLDTCPFLGKHPTSREDISQLREDQGGFTSTNHCSLMFFSGGRCKRYPCWDSISHRLIVFYMAGISVHQSRKLINIWWIRICYYHVFN